MRISDWSSDVCSSDLPEAVTFACKMAIEFCQTFHRDIVIDMWCYRRFGHNEGDEPSFTQPLMYAKIRKHAIVSEGYAARMKAEKLIDDGFVAGITQEFTQHLVEELEEANRYKS